MPGLTDQAERKRNRAHDQIQERDRQVHIEKVDDCLFRPGHKPQTADHQQKNTEEKTKAASARGPTEQHANDAEKEMDEAMQRIPGQEPEDDRAKEFPPALDDEEQSDNNGKTICWRFLHGLAFYGNLVLDFPHSGDALRDLLSGCLLVIGDDEAT